MIAFDSWVIDSSYLYGFLCNIWISQFSHSEDCIQRSHDPSPGSVPAWVLVATEPRILRHTVLPVAQSFFDYGFPFQWPTSKASPLEPKSVAYVRTHTHLLTHYFLQILYSPHFCLQFSHSLTIVLVATTLVATTTPLRRRVVLVSPEHDPRAPRRQFHPSSRKSPRFRRRYPWGWCLSPASMHLANGIDRDGYSVGYWMVICLCIYIIIDLIVINSNKNMINYSNNNYWKINVNKMFVNNFICK